MNFGEKKIKHAKVHIVIEYYLSSILRTTAVLVKNIHIIAI